MPDNQAKRKRLTKQRGRSATPGVLRNRRSIRKNDFAKAVDSQKASHADAILEELPEHSSDLVEMQRVFMRSPEYARKVLESVRRFERSEKNALAKTPPPQPKLRERSVKLKKKR